MNLCVYRQEASKKSYFVTDRSTEGVGIQQKCTLCIIAQTQLTKGHFSTA